MPISNVNRVKSIVVPLTNFNANDIVTIYQNTDIAIGSDLIPDHKIVSFNTFIKNLKVFASIKSLDEAALPDFQLDDSSTQKLQKVLDIEWKSPRKQLNLFIGTTYSDWQQVGSVSLLNPSGYAFRVYNLMDLFTDNLAIELGNDGRIGIQVQNVGYGLLTSEDKVTIHGSYIEEFFVQSNETPININVNVTGASSSEGSIAPINHTISDSTIIGNSFLVGN